ncbi:hypothetical protein [Pengzhenrongella sp.]|jgi:hypothetical protein|uniref:hypothetical protein n=1 Tax=Pengzhenrongella sp. TaxID=2888820 RepID=UPI002F938C88
MSSVPEPGNVEPSGRKESKVPSPAATTGLVLGIVSVVLNPFLVVGIGAVAGFGAIIASAMGLNRASLMSAHGYAPVGKGKAIGGIVLGLVGILASMLIKNALIW